MSKKIIKEAGDRKVSPVLTYDLWFKKNVDKSNVKIQTSDDNFNQDHISLAALNQGMSREEYMAHYAVGSNLDGSDANN